MLPPVQTPYGLPTLRDPDAYELVASMSSSVALHKLISENTTGHVLRAAAGKILSEHTALSSGPLPASQGARPSNVSLTKSVEIPLTGPEAGATIQKLLLGRPPSSFWTPASFCVTRILHIRKGLTAKKQFHGAFSKFRNYKQI